MTTSFIALVVNSYKLINGFHIVLHSGRESLFAGLGKLPFDLGDKG